MGTTTYSKSVDETLNFSVVVTDSGFTDSELKRYDGSNFIPVLPDELKEYGGASFAQKPLKRWDGDSWEDVT